MQANTNLRNITQNISIITSGFFMHISISIYWWQKITDTYEKFVQSKTLEKYLFSSLGSLWKTIIIAIATVWAINNKSS